MIFQGNLPSAISAFVILLGLVWLSDNDGMPDVWEMDQGLDPASATDCWADPDNDGYGNLEEFLNGTDPQKPESAF